MNGTGPSQQVTVRILVNGREQAATVPARLTLADYLRGHLGLTGTHLGCEQGACGACTVLVDGLSARSCLMPVGQADGRRVATVESLAAPDEPLSRLQSAFAAEDAVQCGFCTPGFLMAASELAGRQRLSEEDVREALSGNLCRCTGYEGIVKAVTGYLRSCPVGEQRETWHSGSRSWSPWEEWPPGTGALPTPDPVSAPGPAARRQPLHPARSRVSPQLAAGAVLTGVLLAAAAAVLWRRHSGSRGRMTASRRRA